MKNPFETNKKELRTGFYYDTAKQCIVFYYVGQDEDDDSKYVEIHNRFYSPETDSSMFRIIAPNPQQSYTKDLVELSLSNLTSSASLLEDFKWINSMPRLSKTFVDFLIQEEKYKLLSLNKTFVEQKISN